MLVAIAFILGYFYTAPYKLSYY